MAHKKTVAQYEAEAHWDGECLIHPSIKAYQIVHERRHGPLAKGFNVCHTCDNPACIRDSHHFLGTPADNVADKMAKGRHRTCMGEACSWAKLSAAAVRVIRSRYATGEVTQPGLAAEYGVSHTAIGKIVRGQIWKSVK